MKAKHWLIGLVILLILVGGCKIQRRDAITGQAVQGFTGEIHIGAIEALTGDNSYHGRNQRDAIELAREDINNAGGINNKELFVHFQDGQHCNQKAAIAAAQKFIEQDNFSIVLGPTCSANAMAVAPIFEKAKVIMLASVPSAPALKDSGEYIFRNRASGVAYSHRIAEYAYEKLNARTASTIFINLDNGKGYRDAFIEKFEELGGKVLNSESYEKGNQDFRTQITKIKAENPDVIYIAGHSGHEHAIKQLREIGMNTQILGPITMEKPSVIDIAGEAAEGIIYSAAAFNPEGKDAKTIAYQKKHREKYGHDSESFGPIGYDAMMLIGDAMKVCEENTDCIKGFLYNVKNYPGISGVTTFDRDGEVSKPLSIKTVKNGKFVFVEG